MTLFQPGTTPVAAHPIENAPDLGVYAELSGDGQTSWMGGFWAATPGTRTANEAALLGNRHYIWHRFWVPAGAKTVQVTQNPSVSTWMPVGQDAPTPADGDTYLYLVRSTELLTDETLPTMGSLIGSSDDDGQSAKGQITWEEATGECWFYVASSAYSQAQAIPDQVLLVRVSSQGGGSGEPGTEPEAAWVAPLADGGLPITHYLVRYADFAATEPTVIEVRVEHDPAVTDYRAPLPEGYSGPVQVVAVNEIGESTPIEAERV